MRNRQSGNIFFALFGAIALVGILGAGVMTFMKGPLATSVKLTRQNTAETQMALGAQVAVMAAANTASGGDCDSDGFVEPLEWRDAGTDPKPTGGGLVPMSIGMTKKDPWGTEYGYCAWDYGTFHAAGCGGVTEKRLQGASASGAYPVVALVSAGTDKVFTTTCRSFATADVNTDGDLLDATDLPMVSKSAETDDDIIFTYTYDEATGASGGLWSIKSGDPGTAVIGKNIETTGTANLQGGVLLPDSSLITCDATTAGVMARNTLGTGIEICDGTGWTAISGGGGSAYGAGLVLTPNVSSGMNVDGTCGTATCYSSNVVFTVTNNLSPAAASAVLAVSLSNTTNFEKVSDSCNGVSLAAGANCQITVRAKATGNLAYAATLNITGNNSPFATLDGIASSFPSCNVGGQTAGGYFLACGLSGYDLIVTPGGCTSGTTNPTCAGGADTVQKYGFSGLINDSGMVINQSDGLVNTLTMAAYAGGGVDYPAVSHCDNLVYAGYNDWFLPSLSQLMSYFYPNRTAVGGFVSSGGYISSSYSAGANNMVSYMTVAGASAYYYSASQGLYNVRCMRWSPVKAASPVSDTTPNSVIFGDSYGGPSETRTSNAVVITGLTQAVSISVSGGTSPQYSVNGAAYTSAAGTVVNGDSISLRSTSPIAGIEQVVTLTVGSASFTWKVRTPGNNTIRIFTTSGTYNGLRGGAGGADATCTSVANADGLTGAWVSVMAGSSATTDAVIGRLPWNWKTLKNLNGQVVATSLADFMDGSISAPMNYTSAGALSAGAQVWTGLTVTAGGAGNCNYVNSGIFNSSYSGAYGAFGDSSGTNAGTYFFTGNTNCANGLRILCMESNAAGTDIDPTDVYIQPQIVFASGGTGSSNTISVTGITDIVNVQITPSAGTANIVKDGISVGGTSTTAGLNSTLVFTLTAPTTMGTKNTATITIGADTYTWWVGYADAAREAKVFVTSTTHQGNFGGLASGDAICNTRASESAYGLGSSWKAILSDATGNAIDRMPWNWKTLRTVTGTVVVDGGMMDLFDGSLDASLNVDERGNTINGVRVYTGTNSTGGFNSTGGQTSCSNWTSVGSTYGGCGITNNLTSTWTDMGVCSYSYCSAGYNLYCIENTDNASADTTPNILNTPYVVQVPVSSRQSSQTMYVGGMSYGATQTMSVTATGGNPKFKINGGGEVSSGTVQNGDAIVLVMDAPASGNTSYKMTITAGSMTDYWRVWTGDTTGTAVKRVFVTTYQGSSYRTDIGGVSAVDTVCQSRASNANLGGTWKAIVSGQAETEWAINRVGYNWSTLRRLDGVDVVLAGNLWRTDTTNLLSSISIAENLTTVSTQYIRTGTNKYGKAYNTGASSQCTNWTYYVSGYPAASASVYNGNSGVTSSQWIENGVYGHDSNWAGCMFLVHLYCIEQ